MYDFWIFLYVVGAVIFLFCFVFYLSKTAGAEAERDNLEAQRQKLDTEWAALEQTRRVNEVFFTARDQMRQAEADASGFRYGQRPRPGPSYGPRIVDGQWE